MSLQFQNGGMELDASFSSSFCTELDAQMLVAMETMEKQPRSQKSLPKGMDVYFNLDWVLIFDTAGVRIMSLSKLLLWT